MSKKKEYVQFLEEVLKHVEVNFEGKVKGEINTSIKNNGVPVMGLLLKAEEERVAPNFYLDQQFIEWMRGLRTMEEIAAELCEAYVREVTKNSHLVSDISFTWEEFRRNVFMRLVNKEKNEELLKNIPYREFMDLAVIYYYSVPISDDVTGTMIITQEHVRVLSVTPEELHRAAECNCQRFQPAKIRSMEEVMHNLGKHLGIPVEETTREQSCLYVLSNSIGMFGAVSMIFEGELKRFANRLEMSFFILPSSVHEVILVPEHETFCIEYFQQMVKEINETQVEATEVLSDSIYYYDRKTEELRRVA